VSDNLKEFKMSHLTKALQAATAAALMGSCACLGAATANADPTDTLVGALSKGYTKSNCSPQAVSEVQDLLPTAIAVLQCGQNSDSTGPTAAKYFLLPNSADTASAFTKLSGADTLTKCGDAQSPTVWHQGSSTDSAGQVACGTYQGQAEVTWTTDAKNVVSFVRAANGDVPSLYKWWQANG
jgi:hypothetical protein